MQDNMNTPILLYDAINEWCNGIPYLDTVIGDAEIPFQGESSDLPLALVEYSEKLARNRREPFIKDLTSAFSVLGVSSAERIELPNTFKVFELLVKLSSILQEPRLLQPVEKLLEDNLLEHLSDINISLSRMLAESIFRLVYQTVYRAYITAKKNTVDSGKFRAAHGIVARLAENQYLNELHSVAALFVLNVCNADSIDHNLSLISKITKPERFSLPDNLPEAQNELLKSPMTTLLKIADTLPALRRQGYTRLAAQLFPTLMQGCNRGFDDAISQANPDVLRTHISPRPLKGRLFVECRLDAHSSVVHQAPPLIIQSKKSQYAW